MRGRFGPLRGTPTHAQNSVLAVIFSHHSMSTCLMTQDFSVCISGGRNAVRAANFSGSNRAVLFWSMRALRDDVLIQRGLNATVKPKHVQMHERRKRIFIATTSSATETAVSFRRCVVNQTLRCFGKMAHVWLNGRSVRIIAPSRRLRDYHPCRAGPPNPTQSSAMVSSPAVPTAGLSILGLHRCHHMVNRLSRLISSDPEGWPSGLRHRS
jgi:hypothetical protein